MDELIKELAELEKSLSTMADKMEALDAEAKGAALTEEQQKRWDALESQASGLEAAAERKRKQIKLRESNAPSGRITAPGAPSVPRISEMKEGIEDDPQRGFKSVSEFATSVKRACTVGAGSDVDHRLKICAAPSSPHTTYVGEDGGYLAPPQYRSEIWDMAVAESSLLQLADVQPTESNQVIQTKDESVPWSTTGVVAKWADEASQYAETRKVLKEQRVQLHKCYVFTTASDEELEDAPQLTERLTKSAARAISWKVDAAIVNGDGQGEPLGFYRGGSGAALISVAKEASQTADTIVAANVAKMYGRLLRVGQGSPVWLIHPDAAQQLIQMTLGDHVVWTPPNEGMKQAPGGFLLGVPVLYSQHCQTVGDKGDIVLADLKAGYSAYQKSGGVKFDSSIHLYFDYGVQAFRWTFRVGGKPNLSGAISSANGSSTLSHFVTLDARA